jgi:hypothetical protein
MVVPLVPALSTSLLIAAASGLPAIDVQKTCRAAEAAMVQSNFQSCTDSENSARDQLQKDWSTYPAADRALCVDPGVYMPSYVEWLTCLEMRRDLRTMRKD